jgi:hypothetical protein
MDFAGGSDEMRGKQRVVADIGSDIDDDVAGGEGPRHIGGDRWLPDAEEVNIALDGIGEADMHAGAEQGLGLQVNIVPVRQEPCHDVVPDRAFADGQRHVAIISPQESGAASDHGLLQACLVHGRHDARQRKTNR